MPKAGLPWPHQTCSEVLLAQGLAQPVLVPCRRLRTKTSLDVKLAEDPAVVAAAMLARLHEGDEHCSEEAEDEDPFGHGEQAVFS